MLSVAGLILTRVFTAAAGLAARKLTWGQMLATSSIPVGIATAEYMSDGAVSQKAAETSINAIKAGIKSGVINAKNVESQIDALSTVIGISNVLNKTAQNQAVLAVMHANGDVNAPNAIKAGKVAAAGWLLAPPNGLTLLAKNGARIQLVDDLYPDKNQGDRYLAEKFIDDIVKGSQVNALGNNKLNRDDVKVILRRELSKPDSQLAETIKNSRLGKGLGQIWPEIYTPEKQASAETQTPDAASKPDSPLANLFSRMSGGVKSARDNIEDKTSAAMDGAKTSNPMVMFLIMIMQFLLGLFNGKGKVTAQTDNPERLAALQARNGGNMPSIINHRGENSQPEPEPKIPTNQQRHLQPAP